MSIFCLLWVPFFYLLRKNFSGSGSSGSVIALIFGSMAALLQFFLGYLVTPGGFGVSRWFFGFVDIVCLPVLIPIILYAVMQLFKGLQGDADFANFTLLWLIPVGALRALNWSSGSDPLLLVAVPILWTALAVGVSFFINLMMEGNGGLVKAASLLCILLLPVGAAFTYWAFFSQFALLGFAFFAFTLVPSTVSLVKDALR